MDNATVAEITVADPQNHNTGTLAGIIVGCVALLALISVVSAFCYWWKSTGANGHGLATLPSKCYTISTGRHTPTTCVPGNNGMERRTTEDTSFMLNFMTHNYMDPAQDNFDVDMDNDYFLNSLESSIHFSQPSSGGCLPNGVNSMSMPKDAYYKQRASTTCGYIKDAVDDDDDEYQYSKSPVDPFRAFDSSKKVPEPVIIQPLSDGVGSGGGVGSPSSFSARRMASPNEVSASAKATRASDSREGGGGGGGGGGGKGIQAGITVLPQHLDNYSSCRSSSIPQHQQQHHQHQPQHHHASNHYPSMYGRLISATTRFTSSSSSSSSSARQASSSSHHANQHHGASDRQPQQLQQLQQQPSRQQQQRQQSLESPSAYMLDRGQSLITTFHAKRGKTETLAESSANVLQYPPPMAPISLLMRNK